MKVFVFKWTNEFIGKFEINHLDDLWKEFEKFSSFTEIKPYSYLECAGETWTVVPGADGVELQSGAERQSIGKGVYAPADQRYTVVDKSDLALVLTVIAVLQLIAAPAAGLLVGQNSLPLGLTIFLSGLLSGLILLGFAKIIEHLYECAQRLRNVDRALRRNND